MDEKNITVMCINIFIYCLWMDSFTVPWVH